MRHLGKIGMSPRTYHDLLTMGRSSTGTCTSCHQSVYGEYGEPRNGKMFSLGARANICAKCCEKKGDEVLGPILRAERSARSYIKRLITGEDALNENFIAQLSGAPLDYVRSEISKAKKGKS